MDVTGEQDFAKFWSKMNFLSIMTVSGITFQHKDAILTT